MSPLILQILSYVAQAIPALVSFIEAIIHVLDPQHPAAAHIVAASRHLHAAADELDQAHASAQ